jgi:hypothetical protein
VALSLCNEIQAENRGKWYTYGGLWCMGCVAFTKGDDEKRCWSANAENRGCSQVNRRFDAMT